MIDNTLEIKMSGFTLEEFNRVKGLIKSFAKEVSS